MNKGLKKGVLKNCQSMCFKHNHQEEIKIMMEKKGKKKDGFCGRGERRNSSYGGQGYKSYDSHGCQKEKIGQEHHNRNKQWWTSYNKGKESQKRFDR